MQQSSSHSCSSKLYVRWNPDFSPGGEGDSHIKRKGLFVGNFEKDP